MYARRGMVECSVLYSNSTILFSRRTERGKEILPLSTLVSIGTAFIGSQGYEIGIAITGCPVMTGCSPPGKLMEKRYVNRANTNAAKMP